MCPLSFTVISDKFLLLTKTLKTYLFGMFVLYTKPIGFVNRKMKKFKKIFCAEKTALLKGDSLYFYKESCKVFLYCI